MVDPARCDGCMHPSRCNYDALLACGKALRACPIAGCPVKMRSRDVVRDDSLRASIESLPTDELPESCWLRGAAELRLDEPGGGGAGASAPVSTETAAAAAAAAASAFFCASAALRAF